MSQNADLPTALKRFRQPIEDGLRAALGGSLPLYDMLRYHLGWVDAEGRPRKDAGGKGVRPVLCLVACEGVGGEAVQALPAAVAVELTHNFSLIHDDIEDVSWERRGQETVWRIWGQAQAINAGDAMLALARLSLLRLGEQGVPPVRVLRASRLLDETSLKLCEGQHLDISYEGRLDVSVADYLEMIGGKTAALFECSLKLGALVGSAEEALIEGLGNFGLNLGMAFQIRDDILGIWGREQATGKSATDIRQRKKSLPVAYLLEQASGAEREEIRRIYRQDSIGAMDEEVVLRLLEGVAARDCAQHMADDYFSVALSQLDALAIAPKPKAELEELAAFLVEREG